MQAEARAVSSKGATKRDKPPVVNKGPGTATGEGGTETEQDGQAAGLGADERVEAEQTGRHRPLMDERALRFYVEAHTNLRESLDHQRRLADDAEAARLLRAAGRRALWALEVLQDDDVLWAKLGSVERAPLTQEEIDALQGFADGGLAGLLKGLKYKAPPPVEELVGETVAALVLAQRSHDDAVVASRRVAAARRELSFFAIRLRRLIGSSEGQLPPSLARRLLVQADREADSVLTAVAPVLLEAAADLLLPGAGLAIKVAAAVGGVVGARVLALRPRFDQELSRGPSDPSVALGGAWTAVARLSAQAEAVDALPSPGTDGGPAHDLAIAQAWVADEAIRELLDADPEDRFGWHAPLAAALVWLQTARFSAMMGRPMAGQAAKAEELVGALDVPPSLRNGPSPDGRPGESDPEELDPAA